MIDFTHITHSELDKLETKRAELVNSGFFKETKSNNPIINELRFNYEFFAFGDNLINNDGNKYVITINETIKNIRLSLINVMEDSRKKGEGTRMLKILTDIADKYGYTIELIVSSNFGITKAVLRKWYKKFGFKQSGYDKDFMRRNPISSMKSNSLEGIHVFVLK